MTKERTSAIRLSNLMSNGVSYPDAQKIVLKQHLKKPPILMKNDSRDSSLDRDDLCRMTESM